MQQQQQQWTTLSSFSSSNIFAADSWFVSIFCFAKFGLTSSMNRPMFTLPMVLCQGSCHLFRDNGTFTIESLLNMEGRRDKLSDHSLLWL
ncbi:hypothetical protein BLOT_000469 [Blomia tropicalis]|nr:hypothetical protein BLOT_000469 [Blomia tropicalis]